MRPEAGLPGELAFYGVTAADGYDQLALRSDEATLGFSGAPIWDPQLGAVVGMVKSIARGDPGQRLGNTAIGVPAETMRDLCPELRLPAGCPYRGLEPFTEEHVDYYYGREHATSQLLTSLAARDFVPVVAVSGGGKSSLLQAGLAKGLRDRPVVGLAQRIRCYQRVSGQPHAELLHSLAQHGVLLPREVTAAPPQELAAAIRGAVPATELIVVVDQFERLYTDCEDAAERKRFVELLRCLATGTVKVVIGLRADFYHLALADLGEQLADGQVALAPMSEQDLKQAIAAPAAKLLRSFQPGLTQQLIADVRGRPGDLPLLQFALTELWERDAADGVLTEETYQGLGVELPDGTRLPGAQGALIRRAELLWQDLGLADRLRLQRILLGLIAAEPAETSAASLASGTRDLSRPARLAQWDEEDQRLIQRLIDARLLTADKAPAGGQPTVEVSHEALLRAWPRLRSWLEERSQFVQWRAQDLAPNLERWLDGDKNPEFLLPRSLLEPALRWLRDYPEELAGPPASYIQASKRHRVRRRRLISGAVAVLLIASLVGATIAIQAARTANAAALAAVSGQLAARSEAVGAADPFQAADLAAASWRLAPTARARALARVSLLDVLAQPDRGVLATPGDSVNAVAFSPDGKTLATVGSDGRIRLWYIATRRQLGAPMTADSKSMAAVAFSPDGKILATASDDGTARLWNVSTHQQIGAPMTADNQSVNAVAFSPDGKILATASDDGTARLWNVSTHQQIGAPMTADNQSVNAVAFGSVTLFGSVNAVAFSPDGKMLATASDDGTARLWDVNTHQQVGAPMTANRSFVNAVAFSPDGKMLATASDDGTARLWDVATRRQVGASMTVNGKSVVAVAFSPDGKTLATAVENNAGTWLWDVATQQQVESLFFSNTAVLAVAFSPDGKTLATGSANYSGAGMARLWNVGTQQQVGTPMTAGKSVVAAVAFNPDGKILATGSQDGTARLWNVSTHQQIGAPMTTDSNWVNAVAFSPDGKTLATGGCDGTARLWNAATQQQIGAPMTADRKCINDLAFSPDGKILAAASDDGTARLWNVATHRQIGAPIILNTTVDGVAFSPNSKMLATGSYDGTARLWDVATHRQIGAPMTADTYYVRHVAFSPDGKILATASDDGTARLWDVATQQQIGAPMTADSSYVKGVAFSPDGTTLATTSDDSTARLWDVATQQQIGAPMTAADGDFLAWVTFSPDGTTLAIGGGDGTARLWDVAFPRDLVGAVCAIAGDSSLTRAQWAAEVPSEPFEQTCP